MHKSARSKASDAAFRSPPMRGEVFKKRVAWSGAGKSGGYRFILYFRQGERLFFADMFAKSALANIGEGAKRWYRKVAKEYLEYTEKELEARIKEGWIKEILP